MLRHRCNPCKRLVTGALAFCALAGEPVLHAREAPCAAGPYRDFDFWLGDWEVSGADGRRAGHNRITSEQQGCVLVEHWNGAGGSTGMSMSFYDPGHSAWHQIWVSPGLEIDVSGRREDDSMVMRGTATYLEDGRTRPFRGTWTALPDGRVRQVFEEADDTGIWTSWFEGFYRHPEAAEPDGEP